MLRTFHARAITGEALFTNFKKKADFSGENRPRNEKLGRLLAPYWLDAETGRLAEAREVDGWLESKK
jgi:hypothetical protein